MIPLFLFINESEHERIDWLYLVLFGLLLIPKDYYHLLVLSEASISVFLNPLLMFSIVTLIVVTGLRQFMHERQLKSRLPCWPGQTGNRRVGRLVLFRLLFIMNIGSSQPKLLRSFLLRKFPLRKALSWLFLKSLPRNCRDRHVLRFFTGGDSLLL